MKTAMAAFTTAMLVMPATVALVTVANPAPAFAKKSKADTVKIAKGTEITVKLEDGLDSGKNTDGDTFTAKVTTSMFGDKTLNGAMIAGHVEGIKKAGMMGKKG